MEAITLLTSLRDETDLQGQYDAKTGQVYVEVSKGDKQAVLEGDFSLDELKALVAFMESKP